VGIRICELAGPQINRDFLDSLASLADVGLEETEAREIFRGRLRADVRTYVSLDGDRVVGTLSLIIEQKFIHHGGWVGHIEDVAVHRDFQNRGIGRQLVQYATEEAQRLGCYKVILNCRPERVGFYEKLGYRKHDVGMRIDLEPGS
jgi:glucosamine-phosphate N-acetyltransferase